MRKYLHCSGERVKHPNASERPAEECKGELSLQGDHWSVINIAPIESLAAEDVIRLISEVSPANVSLPKIRKDMEEKLNQGKHQGETRRRPYTGSCFRRS